MRASSHSLYELNQLIKNTIHDAFSSPLWIVAEIMELHVNRSGHCYLELIEKDPESANIRAKARGTIWANQFRMLKPYFESSTSMRLESGIKILFRASIEFHELYGLSLNIMDIDPAYTLGDLARKKQEVIRRLNEEGVFTMNRELVFPAVPQNIAVISSASAAGYGDFINTLEQNAYGYAFRTILFPAILQGEQAAPSIIKAFDDVYERETEFDCVVLIRGGGSQSDLECFNQYELAYHITQFPLPVITGIGHERDESVSDMVASKPLKTPTAVAEFLIDSLLSFEMRLNALSEKLQSTTGFKIREHMLRLQQVETKLLNFATYFLKNQNEKVSLMQSGTHKGIKTYFNLNKEKLNTYQRLIELVHPDTILARGYTISKIDGTLVKDIAQVKRGQVLETVLKKGRLLSKIEEVKSNTKKT